jgi:mannose-6-phosphate isomerase class I
MTFNRPFLIVPTFIPQPTWGGTYIVNEKGWNDRKELAGVRIGQSYELYGKSWLDIEETDTRSDTFGPEIASNISQNSKYVNIGSMIRESADAILGPSLSHTYPGVPILIKFTQALGNSFQLHVREKDASARWKPKPESWYFFEEGYITLGLNTKSSVSEYMTVCVAIDTKMHELSEGVLKSRIPLASARHEAQEFIKLKNPWKYINRIHTQKNTCIDLSNGGIHHSWEEDPHNSRGNILYEVQADVSDDASTLRSFDQGKMKDDGSIRQVTIDDYFTYIDTDKEKNDIQTLLRQPQGSHIFQTDQYTMDSLYISKKETHQTRDSFCHLFVKDGAITVSTDGGSVYVSRGHSCFVPHACTTFDIQPEKGTPQILKTYVETHL